MSHSICKRVCIVSHTRSCLHNDTHVNQLSWRVVVYPRKRPQLNVCVPKRHFFFAFLIFTTINKRREEQEHKDYLRTIDKFLQKDNHCPADFFFSFSTFHFYIFHLHFSTSTRKSRSKWPLSYLTSNCSSNSVQVLFRCTVICMFPPPLALPAATFLIRGNSIAGTKDIHGWLMVDAGLPSRSCPPLTHCVAQAIRSSTSASPTATSATRAPRCWLLEKYPSSQSHFAEEKPFLCEGKSFKSCVSDTWTFNIKKNLSAVSKGPSIRGSAVVAEGG